MIDLREKIKKYDDISKTEDIKKNIVNYFGRGLRRRYCKISFTRCRVRFLRRRRCCEIFRQL